MSLCRLCSKKATHECSKCYTPVCSQACFDAHESPIGARYGDAVLQPGRKVTVRMTGLDPLLRGGWIGGTIVRGPRHVSDTALVRWDQPLWDDREIPIQRIRADYDHQFGHEWQAPTDVHVRVMNENGGEVWWEATFVGGKPIRTWDETENTMVEFKYKYEGVPPTLIVPYNRLRLAHPEEFEPMQNPPS